MKTTVILIRHGETEWNVLHRFQGLSDIPLNDTGRQQAGFAKNGLQNITLDAIYTSPLQRAVETAEIIRGDRRIPVYPTDGLQEMRRRTIYGNTEAGLENLLGNCKKA